MVLTCIDDLNWLTFIIIQFILQKNVGGSNLSQFSSGKSVETSLKAYYKEFKKVKKYSIRWNNHLYLHHISGFFSITKNTMCRNYNIFCLLHFQETLILDC